MTQFLAIILSLVTFAGAEGRPGLDPIEMDRLLPRQKKFEQALKVFAQRQTRGDCPGAICEAAIAIATAHADLKRGAALAAAVVESLEGESKLTAWEANELGVVLFRAGLEPRMYGLAEKAFRHALPLYLGRGANIQYNLGEALRLQGKTADADRVMAEYEQRMIVDPSLTILADFQNAGAVSR